MAETRTAAKKTSPPAARTAATEIPTEALERISAKLGGSKGDKATETPATEASAAPAADAKAESAKEETAAPAADKVQQTPAATFDWDALSEPSAVEYKTAGNGSSTIDFEAVTPEPIKKRVKESFEAYRVALAEETERARQASGTLELTDGQTKRVQELAGRTATRKQECGTLAMAEQFVKLAKAYAASLGYTFRGVAKEGQTFVTYRVKPKETRSRG